MSKHTFQEVSGVNGFVQLIRVGKFEHWGEDIKFTEDILKQLKKNFDDGVRGIDLAIDYFHNSWEEAAGWIKSIELRENDTQLWADVEWTPVAEQRIKDKEVRYLSPDLDFSYKDNESGEKFGAVLLGAGLTNRPAIKNMKAVLAEKRKNSESKLADNEQAMDFETMLGAVSDLSDDEKAQLIQKAGGSVAGTNLDMINQKEVEMSEKTEVKATEKEDNSVKLAEELAAIKAENVKLMEERKADKFAVLLAEGKVVPAQKEAYLSGDVDALIAGAVAIKLDEQGHGGEGKKEEEETAETAAIKLSEAANKIAKDKGINSIEASRLAEEANPELVKLVGA